MSEISVIIPIYNTEKYLRRCVDSILSQTFSDFELILVDNESTDNCLLICKEYAGSDDRIVIIQQKEKGAGNARNAGLDYAINSDKIALYQELENAKTEDELDTIAKHMRDIYGKLPDDMKVSSICRIPVYFADKKLYYTVAEVKQ